MRLRCIKKPHIGTLGSGKKIYSVDFTVGKYYDIIETDNIGYKVRSDAGYKGWVVKDSFESISNMRNDKLKEIGI